MSSSSTHVCMNIASLSALSCASVSSFSRCGLTCSAAGRLLPRTSDEGRHVVTWLCLWTGHMKPLQTSDYLHHPYLQVFLHWIEVCTKGTCYFHVDKQTQPVSEKTVISSSVFLKNIPQGIPAAAYPPVLYGWPATGTRTDTNSSEEEGTIHVPVSLGTAFNREYCG